MTELSPLDVLGKTFSTRLRGYAQEEVHEFLTQVASSMELLLRERGEFKQQLHRFEQELVRFREREDAMQEALVAAQQAAQRTLDGAQAEGQRIVEEGHVLADRLIDEAHKRAHNIETAIGDLRSRRREVRAELMRLAELLEGVIRDDQKSEIDEPATPQLALLRRRNAKDETG
jgi:cell division initiation protein